jgi:hypothetical protein
MLLTFCGFLLKVLVLVIFLLWLALFELFVLDFDFVNLDMESNQQ